MESSKIQNKFILKFGIMANSLLQMGIVGIAVAIAPMILHFEGSNPTVIMSIVTLPSLVCIPVQLFVGANSDRIGNRIPILLGITIVGICGLIPAFFQVSLPVLLLASAGIGIGNGLLIPSNVGLITKHFEGKEAGNLLGIQSGFIHSGAMLLSFLGGILCIAGWRNTFFVYALTIPIFISAYICIPKDKKITNIVHEKGPKARINKEVFIMSLFVFLHNVCWGVINTNNSVFVLEQGLGDSSVVGIAGSVMMGCGVLVGFAYVQVAAIFKKWSFPSGILMVSCGMFIIGSANSSFILFVGSAISGFGFALLMPSGLFRSASSVDKTAKTFAMAIYLASAYVGIFVCPIVFNPLSRALADGSAQSRYLMGSACLLVLALVAFLHIRKSPKPI